MAKFKEKPTTIPALPPIPSTVDPAVKAWLQAAKEGLEVRLGRRGDVRDRAITLRELIESGLALDLSTRPYDPNADISVDFVPFNKGPEDLAVPPKPTSLSASAALTKIILSWTDGWTVFGNHAYTEIYRHTSNSLGDAIVIGTTPAGLFTDNVDPLVQYYYWVRHVSTTDVRGGFSNSVNAAAGVITSSFLANNSVIATKIADGTIAGTKFASGLKGVEVLSSLPSAGTQGRTVFLTSDNKLYRDTGSAWTSVVPTTDLTGTVASGQIANSAITAAKIGADAVTTAKIADNAVTNALIATDAVNADSIVANAVTASEIAAGTITTTQIEAGTIVAADIASGTITTAQIESGTIVAADIASNTITAGQIQAGAIGVDELAAGGITAAKIATNTIVAGNIAAGAITAESAILADASIVTAKIANAQITDALIASATITTASIASAAITNAKIANAAIDTAKVASLYAQSISGDVSKAVAGSLASAVVFANRSSSFNDVLTLSLPKPTHTDGWNPYANFNVNRMTTDKNSWYWLILEMATWNVNSVGTTANETATNSTTPSAFGTGFSGAAVIDNYLGPFYPTINTVSGAHVITVAPATFYTPGTSTVDSALVPDTSDFITDSTGKRRQISAIANPTNEIPYYMVTYAGTQDLATTGGHWFQESIASGAVGRFNVVSYVEWVAVDTAVTFFPIAGVWADASSLELVQHGVKARIRIAGDSASNNGEQATGNQTLSQATGILMGIR